MSYQLSEMVPGGVRGLWEELLSLERAVHGYELPDYPWHGISDGDFTEHSNGIHAAFGPCEESRDTFFRLIEATMAPPPSPEALREKVEKMRRRLHHG